MFEARAHSLSALRLDLDADRNRLANARDCLCRRSEHQVEFAPIDWIDRYSPARPARLVEWRNQFYVKCDRLGYAVNGEVTENVATLRPGLFHAPTLERDLRIFFHIKELSAAQMIVSLFDPCIDAAHVNLRCNGGILRMLSIDLYLATKLREFSVSGSQKLVHAEADCRTGRIEPVCLIRQYRRTQASNYDCSDKIEYSHLELSRFFASVANVFKSGERESGSRPNKFPSANAGLAFNFFSSCTPVIRASSVSKCETARDVGSFVSR
jgi:hypothetical protein